MEGRLLMLLEIATTAAPRSGRDDGAPYGLRELSARAPPRSSRGRSLVRSPRRGRVCRVPTPGGRLFEGGPARSTLLLSGPRRRSEFRAVEEKSGRRRTRGPSREEPAGQLGGLRLASGPAGSTDHR